MTDDPRLEAPACSLNDAEYKARRQYIRMVVTPQVQDAVRVGNELRVTFAEGARTDVEEFARLERQCCGFLTFWVSPPGEPLSLTVVGSNEAQPMLDGLAQGFCHRETAA